ncbi:MAG: AraC family transcriptional regulator, partial [Burkholderiales bacterium]|nr:AraC family transcriptional regulator [Burkholderiales bacterium]
EDWAPVLLPGAQHLVIAHLVIDGRCWIEAPGAPARELRQGDIALLPRGDAHRLGSSGTGPPRAEDAVVLDLPELVSRHFGGQGPSCRLASAWFAYDHQVPNPLMAALPHLVVTNIALRAHGAWLSQSVAHALEQAAAGPPGSGVIAGRVAEALFVEALRGHLEALPQLQTGWLAALRDPPIGHCLTLMHGDPAHGWTVRELAQQVGMSRSVLAQHFTERLGMPPMQYLKRWRLAAAARLLGNQRISLSQVAETVGYDSEASFNRAFKSIYGVAPGLWRRKGAPQRDLAFPA